MPKLSRKPGSWFVIKNQVRKSFADEELLALGQSMKERQLEPVGALSDGHLIYGERRVRAALRVGIDVDVLIYDEPLTDSQIKIIQFTENVHRSDLSAWEKFLGCKELLALNPQWKAKDLSDHLHIDPSMVTRLLSPARCIPAWQEALAGGTVGISDCYAASQLSDSDQSELLALKLSGAGRDVIEATSRKKRSVSTDGVKLSRVKMPLPSGTVVSVEGKAIGLSNVIESLQELLKLAKKAHEDGLNIKTFQSACKDKALKK